MLAIEVPTHPTKTSINACPRASTQLTSKLNGCDGCSQVGVALMDLTAQVKEAAERNKPTKRELLKLQVMKPVRKQYHFVSPIGYSVWGYSTSSEDIFKIFQGIGNQIRWIRPEGRRRWRPPKSPAGVSFLWG